LLKQVHLGVLDGSEGALRPAVANPTPRGPDMDCQTGTDSLLVELAF